MAVTGCGEQRMSKQILSVSSAYNQPTVITNTKANTNTNTKTKTNTNTKANTNVNTTTHKDTISALAITIQLPETTKNYALQNISKQQLGNLKTNDELMRNKTTQKTLSKRRLRLKHWKNKTRWLCGTCFHVD